MSAKVEEQNDDIMADHLQQAQDALSDIGDRSSSLSDIEDKEGEQDEQDEHDNVDDLESGNDSPDENDSEAETERLEDSPHSQRKLKDVVVTSHADSQTFSKSPSKLQQQIAADEDEEEEDDDDNDVDELSEEEVSVDGSPKSPDLGNTEQDPTTATTSLEDSSGESKGVTNVLDQGSKKRKRSLLVDHDPEEGPDLDEPASKRTGSIGATADEYMAGDTASANDEGDVSNPISGDISDIESADAHGEDEDPVEPNEEDGVLEDDALDTTDQSKISVSKFEGKKTRKQPETSMNGVDTAHDNEVPDADKDSGVNPPGVEDDEADEGEELGDADVEDAEAAIRNEEEQNRKRFAMDQLGDIEQHFASFRDRLHEERLSLLDREEEMLRQDPPTHPQYLAMLQCIDARRDEKLRIEQRLIELRRESMQRSAVAKRSQIFAQFYQDVRDIREQTLELLGKQWYDIQHDRRGYGLNVEDYAIKFPTRRSQQLKDQIAYNTEVSILSGIAKHVGFPAAPPMAPATSAERDLDLEKMGRSQHKQSNRAQPSLPLQDLAALRAATSSSTFNPAEEQFIESTPWANPQHPSHIHLLQRQTSNHQSARTASPFSSQAASQTSRISQQGGSNLPVSGTFTTHNSSHATNGGVPSADRVSSLNPFSNKKVSSPLDGQQASLSPEQNRQPAVPADSLSLGDDTTQPRTESHTYASSSATRDVSQGFTYDPGVSVKREQPLASGGRY